jgi:hypothetical protein
MFEGRALGTQGMYAASYHIAQQFKAQGVQPAGAAMSYFQERTRSFEQLDDIPHLAIHDGGADLTYHQDFVEYVSPDRNIGHAEGQVRFVALGKISRDGARVMSYTSLERLDFSDDVLLTTSPEDANLLRRVPCAGILIIADSNRPMDRRQTLSMRDPHYLAFGTGRVQGRDIPRLWITEATAQRLLQDTDYSIEDLRAQEEKLDLNEVFELPTPVSVSMEVHGTVKEREPVRHVLGNWTGVSDSRYGGLNNQMIVVMAQYDTPPRTPDDSYYAGANDNASGVAVMLEAIRAMKESGYQPYRTFLFVAYAGEGQEGGEWVYPPDTERFLEAKKGFAQNFDIEAVVDLRGAGAGEGNGLLISAGGSMRLADLFQESANQMGIKAERGGEQVDISIVFEEKSRYDRGQEAPKVGIHWDGWEGTSCRPEDTVANLSEEKLERAGRVVSVALMTLGRERQY